MQTRRAKAGRVFAPAQPMIRNRIKSCFPGEGTELSKAWGREIGAVESEDLDIRLKNAMWLKSGTREAAVDPAQAGLRAVAPDAARWRAYYARQFEEGLASLRQDVFERIERLEAALAERVKGGVKATEDVSEDMFTARHNLEPMWRFAQEAARSIYGPKLVRIEQRLDTDQETGAPFLAVDIDAAVEREEYTPLQDRFLDMVWGQFEHVNPRAILFSFHSV